MEIKMIEAGKMIEMKIYQENIPEYYDTDNIIIVVKSKKAQQVYTEYLINKIKKVFIGDLNIIIKEYKE